jgi:hypothetical protein
MAFLLDNPQIVSQVVHHERNEELRQVVVQTQLHKARPQLNKLLGAIGMVAPRTKIDEIIMPVAREAGEALGGVLFANAPNQIRDFKAGLPIVSPADARVTFNVIPGSKSRGSIGRRVGLTPLLRLMLATDPARRAFRGSALLISVFWDAAKMAQKSGVLAASIYLHNFNGLRLSVAAVMTLCLSNGKVCVPR